MSAGVQPEGFENYMADIRGASIRAVQVLGGYDDRIMIPSLIMALVSVVKIHVDEGRIPSMEFGINLVHEGIEALSDDYKRQMGGLDNGN